jgi:hypothetical protein
MHRHATKQRSRCYLTFSLGNIVTITLIFGAGASFGSGACIPYNPPLGMHLFEKLEELGGAFSQLPQSQKQIFIQQGFEAGMASIPNNSIPINRLQREIAVYLSHIFPEPQNSYVRLFNKLQSCITSITVTTLNYDLLIEQSLVLTGIPFSYAPSNRLRILKPHGSSNFLPDLGRTTYDNCAWEDCDIFLDDLQVDTPLDPARIIDWCRDQKNNSISPVLSMYSPDKRTVMNLSLIRSIQRDYAEIIQNSKLIALVGVGLAEHDEHIWDPISKSRGHLCIVDIYPDKVKNWAQAKNIPTTVFREGFEKSVWNLTKEVHRYT